MSYYENISYFDCTMGKYLKCTRHYPPFRKYTMWKIKYDKHDNRNVKTKLEWLKKCKRTTKKWTEKTKHANDSIAYHRTKYSGVQIYTKIRCSLFKSKQRKRFLILAIITCLCIVRYTFLLIFIYLLLYSYLFLYISIFRFYIFTYLLLFQFIFRHINTFYVYIDYIPMH